MFIADDNSFAHICSADNKSHCLPVATERVRRRIAEVLGVTPEEVSVRYPFLVSPCAVGITPSQLKAMQATLEMIEYVSQTAWYNDQVTRSIAANIPKDFGPKGVMMGYDFHFGDDTPKLIEINTNAGGAFIINMIISTMGAFGTICECFKRKRENLTFEAMIDEMFRSEWRHQGRSGAPEVIAIVDVNPQKQFLYADMVICKALLERRGYRVIIADPATLRCNTVGLWCGQERIDIVYNRLCDFNLSTQQSAEINRAYMAGLVVVTPNPSIHARLADKRNLAVFSDPALSSNCNLTPEQTTSLRSIPNSGLVHHDNAAWLWSQRRRFFFKPAGGYAGKAVFRGDKMTRANWTEIQQGRINYIYQEIAPPLREEVMLDGQAVTMKSDVRLYSYEGKVLLVGARRYSGFITNFRTPGSGFCPVVVV